MSTSITLKDKRDLEKQIEKLDAQAKASKKILEDRLAKIASLNETLANAVVDEQPVIEFPDTSSKLQKIFALCSQGKVEYTGCLLDEYESAYPAISDFIENSEILQVQNIVIEIEDCETDDTGNYDDEGEFWGVFKVYNKTNKDNIIYWKASGWKSSYDGARINNIFKVEPAQKTITVYKKVK